MSYIGHGLSHAIFGGAVLSYVLNLNFFIGAGIWTLLASGLIHLISHRRWVGADAAIGVVTTSSFALGVAIISTHRQFTRNIEAALFGNILGITGNDLAVIVAISLLVFAVLVLIRRQLLFATFDPEVASAYGVATGKTDLLFVVLLAVTVLAATRITWALLYGGSDGYSAGDRPLSDPEISDLAHRLAPDRRILWRRRHVFELLLRYLVRRQR